MSASSTIFATNCISTSFKPERNQDGLVVPSYYEQFINNVLLPDDEVEITHFNQAGEIVTDIMRLHKAIGDSRFIMSWQPGASVAEEVKCELYSKKPGDGGCGGEVIGFDESFPMLAEKGCEAVVICSTKSSEQQRKMLAEKKKDLPNCKVMMLSDPEGRLARIIGLHVKEETVVNKETNEPKNIHIVDRVTFIGGAHIFYAFTCPALMKDYKNPREHAANLHRELPAKYVPITSKTAKIDIPTPVAMDTTADASSETSAMKKKF